MKQIKLFNKITGRCGNVWDEYYLHSEDDEHYHVIRLTINDKGHISDIGTDGYHKAHCRYEVIEPESKFPIENCNCWNGDEDHTGVELNPYGPFIVHMEYDGGYIATDNEGHPHRWDNYEVINIKPMTAKEIADRVCRQAGIGGIIGIIELKDEIKKRGIEGE